MSNEEPYSSELVTCFVDLLKNELPEHRDNRGKRHPLAFVKDSGLDKQKVSLDAHHFNATTTAQIHQAGGLYLTQVKENQAVFLQQCKIVHKQFLPLAETIGHEKENGRVTTRNAHVFFLTSLTLDSRWKRGISLFLRKLFYGHPCPTSGKNYATANAFGGPSRLVSLVAYPTRGMQHRYRNDSTPVSKRMKIIILAVEISWHY